VIDERAHAPRQRPVTLTTKSAGALQTPPSWMKCQSAHVVTFS